MPDSSGNIRGISVPRVWPGHPDWQPRDDERDEPKRYSWDEMIARCDEITRETGETEFIVPVYAGKKRKSV